MAVWARYQNCDFYFMVIHPVNPPLSKVNPTPSKDFSPVIFFWKVAKNVVPNARGLALAVRQHLETMLSNLPAPDSTVELSGCMKPDQIQPKTDAGMPTMVRGQALLCYGMLFPCRTPNPRVFRNAAV